MPNTKFSQLPVLGNVTAATIVPVVESGVNYQVSGANLQAFVNSSTGNITGGNIVSLGAVTATGNVSGSYILGNGSQLTGIPASYGNANVAAYLPTFTGNLAGGNAIITSGVSAATFTGSGSGLTSIPGANVSGTVANAAYATAAGTATSATSATTATTAGTVTTAAQPNITSVGTLSVVNTSGNVSAVGNIAGSFFVGNGSALTGIVANTTYNDANVAAFLPTYTGAMTAMTGAVSTTGNVTGAYVKGNGANLTGIVNSIVAGSGISISASTGAVTVTNTGGSGGTAGKIVSSFATGTVGANSETVSLYATIPANTFATNDTIRIKSQWLNNSGTTVQRVARIYINTSLAIPASALNIFGGYTSSFAGQYYDIQQTLNVISDTGTTRGMLGKGGIGIIQSSSAYASGLGPSPTGSQNSFTINWTVNQYIIFTCQNATGSAPADGLTCIGYQIYKE